jgi:hypothetical protein
MTPGDVIVGPVDSLGHQAGSGGVGPETVPQPAAAAVQPRGHGWDRRRNDVRDLGVGITLHVSQVDHDPNVVG